MSPANAAGLAGTPGGGVFRLTIPARLKELSNALTVIGFRYNGESLAHSISLGRLVLNLVQNSILVEQI